MPMVWINTIPFLGRVFGLGLHTVHFDQIEEQKNNPTMKYRLVYSYRGDYQFKHCYLRARVMPYAKEREAAGNQETFKPQEHGLANVMLGGIIRLPCEEYIFVQALSLELAMALPINREIQSSLHCDAFIGVRRCTRVQRRTRVRLCDEGSKKQIQGCLQCFLTRAPLLSY